ncbi:hypothetical protein JCM10450v2_003285 [Rhodotorula kratochvilovae]
MLDRLPVELSRHILSLAHPPPARGPAFADALLARQRSLIACQRVCKSLKEVARELLWERVWYRSEASSQVDHLVTTEGDEGWLVRNFEYERAADMPECVDPTDAIRKMPDLVELAIRLNVAVELDMGVLFGLKNLTSLALEANKIQLVSDANPTFGELLEHLVLGGVCTPTPFHDTFFQHFFAACTPALKTLAISRLEAGGNHLLLWFSETLFLQFDVLHISLAEYALMEKPIDWTATPIVASLDERGARILGALLYEQNPRFVCLGMLARHLALDTAGVRLDFPDDRPVAGAVRIARVLVTSGHVQTLFLPRHLRARTTVSAHITLDVIHRRKAEVVEAYAALRKACVDKGVETFFLDKEADVAQWPAWAQEEPALRRLVDLTEEFDAWLEASRHDARRLLDMPLGPNAESG